jgi:DNA-3-methyladenine glycosylase
LLSEETLLLQHRLRTDTDVVQLAQDLLGCGLCTHIGGIRTTGIITETEAYRAPEDRASHAYGNRRTRRTEVMFAAGGHAYIYLCYGIHHLFNVVTGPEGMAHAVLVRAVWPVEGLETMLQRRRMTRWRPGLTTGPGVLSQALGLTTALNGQPLFEADGPVWLTPRTFTISRAIIQSSPRIGVDYAGECAAWPWRFFIPFAEMPALTGEGRDTRTAVSS